MTKSLDEASELVKMQVDRVDAVNGPATGIPFLMLKAADLTKVKYSAAEMRSMAAHGQAHVDPDGSINYPVADKADLESAIHAVGRSKGSHDSIRAFLMRRATALGASSMIPDNWNKDGSMKVTKASANDAREDDAANVVIGDDQPIPDGDALMEQATENADGLGVPTRAPGDPDDPTSPAWEAVDAARARQAIELTVALRRLVSLAQDREQQEASVDADGDDLDNVFDLGDVQDALQFVLETLAPFAVGEQAEADGRTAETTVMKAGRVLSSVNEQRIRAALERLQQIIGSLPPPTVEEGTPVDKTPTTPEAAPVAKAKGDPMVACYDAQGNLLGAVAQADMTPLAAGTPVDAPAAEAPDDTSDEPATDAATDTAPAPDATDTATIPGTETVVSPTDAPVAKAAKLDLSGMLAEALAPVAKQLEANSELAAVVKGLQEQVEALRAMPDNRRSPLLNGATGTPGLASRNPDDEHIEGLRKSLAEETNPGRRADLSLALAVADIKQRFAN
ncbi:MAG: hypothetical protein ACYCV4_02045 [Dermatophilaceae bacterium]